MTRCSRTFLLWTSVSVLSWVCSPQTGMSYVISVDDEEQFKALDKNEDEVLSGKEVAGHLQHDTDNDGEVTKAEYVAGKALARQKFLAIDDDQLFKEQDKNEDDVLSGTEVTDFIQYDTDKDGEVSRKEFDTGRDADRGIPAGPSPEELAQMAAEKFRELDINEDGRLSGKEVGEFQSFDVNSDRRITEKEFVDGFVAQVAEPAADPVAVFVDMIRTTDPAAFLKASSPEFAQQMDAPVLTFIMQDLEASLGPVDPASKTALVKTAESDNPGEGPRTLYRGKLNFKEGTADVDVIVSQNQIIGFQLETPVLTDVSDRLYRALFEDKDFGKSTAEYYTPRCEKIVELILVDDDDAALTMFHPEVQKQESKEKFQNLFETLRTNCGTFKGFELESMRVEFDANGKGQTYQLSHLVRGSKQDYMTTTTFQFMGLSAAVVALSVEPATEEQSGRTPGPGSPNQVEWSSVSAIEEGIAFELPGNPERTKDDETQRVSYNLTTHDGLCIWYVCIDTVKDNENLELRANELLDYMQQDVVKNTGGELIDTDEANLGDHPGRLYVIKTKEEAFVVERMVIVGSRVCHFQLTTTLPDKRSRETLGNHFLDSVRLIAADDDVPAAPVPAPSETPAPPAPSIEPPAPAPPRP